MIQSWTNHERAPLRRGRGGRRKTAPQGLRFRPRVELLEDRRLLSAGAIDPTFGQHGVTAPDSGAGARAVVVEADGKILALNQTATGYDLWRYGPDGTPDDTFGAQGKVTGSFGEGTAVFNLGLLTDGRIVVAGVAGAGAHRTIDVARFNADGSADATFGSGGLVAVVQGDGNGVPADLVVGDAAVQAGGAVVLSGTAGNQVVLVGFNVAGGLDPFFGSGGVVTTALSDLNGAQPGGVAFQPDGKVLVTAAAAGQLSLLRYQANGNLDTTFGAGGVVHVTLPGTSLINSHVAVDRITGAIAVTADSYTVGDSPIIFDGYVPEHFNLFRFHADGSPDTAFGDQGQVSNATPAWFALTYTHFSHDVAFQDDGKLLVAQSSPGASAVVRYNADGSLDLTFGNGGSAGVDGTWAGNPLVAPTHSLALQGDGKVVAASDKLLSWDDAAVPQTGALVTRLQADSDIRPGRFGSEAAFREYLIEQMIQRYGYLLGQQQPSYYYYQVSYAAAAAIDAPAAPSHSQTNVQVAGVDEGDTVKTDGQYLYVVANGKLTILNAWPAGDLHILSVTALQGTPVAEYLNGNRLTVITQDYLYDTELPGYGGGFYPLIASSGIGVWPYWGHRSHPVVHVTEFDVADPDAPVVERDIRLDGTLSASRAIGDTVYVALGGYYGTVPGPAYTDDGTTRTYATEAEYRAQLEALPLEDLLPHYTTHYTDATGEHDVTGLISNPADIYRPATPDDNSLLSVVSFDVGGTTAGPTHAVSLLTAYGAQLFATADNFYLITNRWSYVSNWTFINKLSLADGDIILTATGRVPGVIVNSYSAGENGDYFYIATGPYSWEQGTNAVYVLAEHDHLLDVVGKVEGLAPGETIRSVRFLGDRAFVTTAAVTDPLFALDLHDPTHPVVAGALELTGYNGYLQAINATHLIGIGRDEDPVTHTVGDFQVSLYDVSDLSHPVLLSRYHVAPQGWVWSAADYDFHAITWYPELQALALPITGYGPVTFTDPSGVVLTQWVDQTGLLVFHVDVAAGTLDLKGEVADGSTINRSVFIGDQLYSISYTTVQVQSWDDLGTVVNRVQLPAPDHPGGWWWWNWGWPVFTYFSLQIIDDAGVVVASVTAPVGDAPADPDPVGDTPAPDLGGDAPPEIPDAPLPFVGPMPGTSEGKAAATAVTTPLSAPAANVLAISTTVTEPAPLPTASFLVAASQGVTSTPTTAPLVLVSPPTSPAPAPVADAGTPAPKPHISAGGQEQPAARLPDPEGADAFQQLEGETAAPLLDGEAGRAGAGPDAAMCAAWATVWREELSSATAPLYRALADEPAANVEDAGREDPESAPLWALALAALVPAHHLTASRRERRPGWPERG